MILKEQRRTKDKNESLSEIQLFGYTVYLDHRKPNGIVIRQHFTHEIDVLWGS